MRIRAVGRSSVATGPGRSAGAAWCRVRRSALPIPPSRLVSLWVALWDGSRSGASWCSCASRERWAGRGSSPWKLHPGAVDVQRCCIRARGNLESAQGRRILPLFIWTPRKPCALVMPGFSPFWRSFHCDDYGGMLLILEVTGWRGARAEQAIAKRRVFP